MTRDDLPSDKRVLYDQVAAHRGHVARPFAALLNSPDVASRVAMVGEQLRYVSDYSILRCQRDCYLDYGENTQVSVCMDTSLRLG